MSIQSVLTSLLFFLLLLLTACKKEDATPGEGNYFIEAKINGVLAAATSSVPLTSNVMSATWTPTDSCDNTNITAKGQWLGAGRSI